MLKLIFVATVLILAIVGGLAVALNHFFGWKGLIAFPFLLIALVWVGKVVIGKMIKHVALGLFSIKSGVLRGATMTLHSVTAATKPSEPGASDGESSDTDTSEESKTEANDDQEEQAEVPDEP